MKHIKSILQLDWDRCFFPICQNEPTDVHDVMELEWCLYRNCNNEPTQIHHVLHGNKGNKRKSEEDGLLIHVCQECHNAIHFGKEGGQMDRSLKRLAQIKWEEKEKSSRVKNVTLRSVREVETYIEGVEREIRADWMRRYGHNYR